MSEQAAAEPETSGREMDRQVAAEVCGWRWYIIFYNAPDRPGWAFDRVSFLPPRVASQYPIGSWSLAETERSDWEDVSVMCLPRYSTDIAAAYDMEAEIERQGLAWEYGEALESLCYREAGVGPVGSILFRLAHASPEMRCRAALRVVRERKESR